jgi:hypothetical protein
MARFNQYRSIVAKFDQEGFCGHKIRRGDTIGWCSHARHATQCKDCWSRWQAENAEAEVYESYMS